MQNQDAFQLLHNPRRNKGTAFTEEERRDLHIEGLIPPVVETMDRQVDRVIAQMDAASDDLHRYTLLRSVQDRENHLFYKVLISDPERFLPMSTRLRLAMPVSSLGTFFADPVACISR